MRGKAWSCPIKNMESQDRYLINQNPNEKWRWRTASQPLDPGTLGVGDNHIVPHRTRSNLVRLKKMGLYSPPCLPSSRPEPTCEYVSPNSFCKSSSWSCKTSFVNTQGQPFFSRDKWKMHRGWGCLPGSRGYRVGLWIEAHRPNGIYVPTMVSRRIRS